MYVPADGQAEIPRKSNILPTKWMKKRLNEFVSARERESHFYLPIDINTYIAYLYLNPLQFTEVVNISKKPFQIFTTISQPCYQLV